MTTETTETTTETPTARFKRIANPRLATCQTAIRSLGKCSGKDYEYTAEQVETIKQILQKEVDDCVNRFLGLDEAANTDLL